MLNQLNRVRGSGSGIGIGSQHEVEELEQMCEATYQGEMAERGVRTYIEEREACRDLLYRCEQYGEFPSDGNLHMLSLEDVDDEATTEAAIRALQSATSGGSSGTNRRPLIGMALLVFAGIMFVVVLFGGGSGSKSNGQKSAGQGTSVAGTNMLTTTLTMTGSLTETLAAASTMTALANEVAPEWGGSSIEVGTDYKQALPPVYPETLEIDGTPFRTYPSAIEGGKWEYKELEDTASWQAGSVVNWSFGIPALDPNMKVMQRLVAGAQVPQPTEGTAGGKAKLALMRMSSGAVRRFRLGAPIQVAPQQIEYFSQLKPGITIVLLGRNQGTLRWLVQGVEEDPFAAPGTATP